MTLNLSLQQIRILSAIARHRNVTKAAAELYTSQPSLTYQLRQLEEEIDSKLYRKIPSGIVLTAQGRRLLRHAEAILQEMEAIEAKFGLQNRGKQSAPLAIGGSNGPSANFLPRLASRFRETHADTEVTLRAGSSLALEKMVQSGEIEIAVVTHCAKLTTLKYERGRTEKLVFFAPRGRYAPRMSLEELGRTPLVIFRQGLAGAALKFLRHMESARVRPNIAMRLEAVEAVKTAVRSGTGVGMLYRDNLLKEIERGEIQLIEVAGLDMTIDSTIVYPRGNLSPAAGEFLSLLREARKERGRGAFRSPVGREIGIKVLSLAPLAAWLYSWIGQVIEDAALIASSAM
jgi:DNA-binding transcriptional LysR family regulator